MEVVVTEEKKKIFRARKTMKISDRHQLETLHSTLLTSSSGLSSSSPPPLVNGTHNDGQKLGDKEQADLESHSPNATSPTSPDPCLSLKLSPSPPSSQSPNTKEEPPASPGSPFHSLNSELKRLESDEKTGSSSRTSNKSDTPASKESEKKQENSNQPVTERKEVENETKDGLAAVNSGKTTDRLLSSSPVELSDCSEPMETDSNTSKANSEATTVKKTDQKPSAPKSSPSTSSTVSTAVEQKNKKEIKEDNTTNQDFKKEPLKGKLDMDVKVETKKEKNKVTKPSRPSSTPPANSVKEEKSSTSGLKRTLSEGFDGHSINKEVKRPKMESEEFEAQLELKITAKAGTHTKLEKIVQKLVEERLRALELTIFDRNFQELKNRVDKIDCATKHQNAINTLQVKLARLAKKFGEANQASENKRKQEALAAAVAAANATNTTTTPAPTGPTAKTVSSSPQTQRALQRETEQLKTEVSTEGQVPSVGWMAPARTLKKENNKQDQEDEKIYLPPRNVSLGQKLTEYSEGKCKPDIKLRTISSDWENMLYMSCQKGGNPRVARYASYIFRYLVPYEIYCDWVSTVNYVGLLGKYALPINLRRTLRKYIEERFPELSSDNWKEIRDVINDILRVKRSAEFFSRQANTVHLW